MARDRSPEKDTLDLTDLQKSRETIDQWARQQSGGAIHTTTTARVSTTEPNSARF